MNGHQQLIAMRRVSRAPASVFVVDGVDPASTDWHQFINDFSGKQHAVVQIDAQDVPEALDLRYVVGLVVHLIGARSADRTRRLFDALVSSKAKSVGTVIDDKLVLHGIS